jgi:uncharacterized repeat protein (TIGR03803 family)
MRFLILCLLLVSVSHAQTATESVVYTFCPGDFDQQPCSDSQFPQSKLVQGLDGNLYGTTPSGGAYGLGTIFKIAGGVETILYSFSGGQNGFQDGSVPYAGLIQASDGNFYGVTYGDGSVDYDGPSDYICVDQGRCGTIFKFDVVDGPQNGGLTTLHTFCGQGDTCTDGFEPYYALIQGSDGNLYGSTTGLNNIFKISLAGAFSSLAAGGSDIVGSLTQGSDGNFYVPEKDSGNGGILQLIPPASLNTIYSFTGGNDGKSPVGALVEGSDGNLYGTTDGGGASGEGTIFKVSTAGTLGVLASYCSAAQPTCHDGYKPNGDLFLASDGNFYESTQFGGVSTDCPEGPSPNNVGCGEIVEVSSTGVLTDLYSFTGASDGSVPLAGLIQASDGNLYGTSSGQLDTEYNYGNVYEVYPPASLVSPVELSLSQSSITLGSSVTVNFRILNAFSATMQQCYGFSTGNGVTVALGKVSGTSANGVFAGSTVLVPNSNGTYNVALTCGGIESGFASLTVGGKSATSAGLTVTTPVTLGGTATLTATPTTAQSIVPLTGSVSFSSGSTPLGSLPLTNGSAVLNVAATGIAAGTYPITATYSGDANYQSSSATANVIVQGYATSTALGTSVTSLAQGQSITLTANVARTAASGAPTGNVTFYYGPTALTTIALNNGKAAFTAVTNGSIAPGAYAVTAKYLGDPSDQSSASDATDVTLLAATKTSLQISPGSPVPVDHTLTLTATVRQAYGSGIPTGTIKFASGSYQFGTATMSGGVASVNTTDTGFPAGTYTVTATYSGDANNAASSATVNVVVQ